MRNEDSLNNSMVKNRFYMEFLNKLGMNPIILLNPLILISLLSPIFSNGQDLSNGTYKNPILHADYSDPDAIRVGDDFYMTSSSFEDVPGLPILHSKDLVNWKLIGHALKKLVPQEHFSVPRHGEGVWAPSIRYRNGEFLIYYPDPDFGLYLIKAKNAAGPWSEPILVEGGKGLIDPCPLWDDDGNAYLVHAYAGSRAGIKSIIVVKKMNKEGTKVIDEGRIVYDGHELDPTIEGPKFYKRNGWYYIFAPAGGVSTGWQTVLRSKNVYGPYERKVVMDQGSTTINGPHQGAWVDTKTGEHWFLHFQDKEAYGRIVHLQPMKWINDWPVIGVDKDGDGKGEPVMVHKKPNVGKSYPAQFPAESDEFNTSTLGLQWQWMANPSSTWYFTDATRGVLRLYSQKLADTSNLWGAGNVLQQKFPAENFIVTTKLSFTPNPALNNESAGLSIMGESYYAIALKNINGRISVTVMEGTNAQKNVRPTEIIITEAGVIENKKPVTINAWFRATVKNEKGEAVCQLSYSLDGINFTPTAHHYFAKPGRWKGAKIGIFCTRNTQTNDSGFADFDWIRLER